jgi:hypothetical protein
MNRSFLQGMHSIWQKHGLLGDTANLDFATIPYWGDASHLENNWSGTRHTALASMLAVLAQEPASGIITYSDTTIRHDRSSDVVLEFLDFYNRSGKGSLNYLVFDSKFTTYENLARLDPEVMFITIRRRGKSIVEDLEKLPRSSWKTVHVPAADGKGRTIRINDSRVFLRDYGKELRQVAITGHGKLKPALIITNDLEREVELIIRTYARRWLVEKEISEQIEFFHLNRLSSSIVIKVDFDLTMSVLAHNLLRILARDIKGYEHATAQKLYEKLLSNRGEVIIRPSQITVKLNKKRALPLLLTAMERFQGMKIRAWDNLAVAFVGDSRS